MGHAWMVHAGLFISMLVVRAWPGLAQKGRHGNPRRNKNGFFFSLGLGGRRSSLGHFGLWLALAGFGTMVKFAPPR
jgi:hypothetical protein